ncbi:MAG TPA: nuclear transport factor 2 family protein [Sphingomonadaceae bacterium]|nr:nuclear transport factor 2 family protein [Sphingomonadaceae bacterium]
MKTFASALSLALTGAALGSAPFMATSAFAAEKHQNAEETNKKLVLEFYDLAINKKDYDAAAKYLGDKYVQHNPTAADGPEGLKGFIDFLKSQFPQQHNEVKHVYTDGDFVILHVHSVRTPGSLGRAIVDIFRLEKGKVVEHWDVIQDVPDPAGARNGNGMF